MATPILDQYRQLNPQDTRPDGEVLVDIAETLHNAGVLDQHPEVTKALRFANRPSYIQEAGRAVASGVDQMQANFFSLGAMGAGAVGAKETEQKLLQGYERNIAQAAELAPTVGSFEDAQTPEDYLRYGIGLVGNQVPQFALTAGATALGGLAGAGVAGTAATTAARAAAMARGATLGANVAGFSQMQNYADLVKNGGEDPLVTAATVGAVGAWLEGIVPGGAFKKAFAETPKDLTQEAIKGILTRAEAGLPGLSTYMFKAAGDDALKEGVTEIAQEITAMAGEAFSNRNNPDFKLSDEEIKSRILNNGLGGVFLGAGFGAVTGISDRRAERKLVDTAQALDSIEKARIAGNEAAAQAARDAHLAALQSFAGQPNAGAPGAVANPTGQDEYDTYLMQKYVKLFDEAGLKRLEIMRAEKVQDAAAAEMARLEYEALRLQLRIQQQEMGIPIGEGEIPGNQPANNPPFILETQNQMTEAGAIDSAPGSGEQGVLPEAGRFAFVSNPLAGLRTAEDGAGGPTPVDTFLRDAKKSNDFTKSLDGGLTTAGSELVGGPTPIDEAFNRSELDRRSRDVVKAPAGYKEMNNELPPISALPISIPEGSSIDAVVEAVGGMGENDKGGITTSNRLLFTQDKRTGKVLGLVLYKGSGNKVRVAESPVKTVNKDKYLSEVFQVTPEVLKGWRKISSVSERLDQVWADAEDVRTGNRTLEEFFQSKLPDGSARFAPLSTMRTSVPLGNGRIIFDSVADFQSELSYAAPLVEPKLSEPGSRANAETVLNHVTALDPKTGNAINVIATLLGQMTMELTGGGRNAALRKVLEANPNSILARLLNLKRMESKTLNERLAEDSVEPFIYKSGGKVLGLFTAPEWETVKGIVAGDVTAELSGASPGDALRMREQQFEDLKKIIAGKASTTGMTSFLSSVTISGEELGRGSEYIEGGERETIDPLTNIAAEPVDVETVRDFLPEAKGFATMSDAEASVLAWALGPEQKVEARLKASEEKRAKLAEEIMQARQDSEDENGQLPGIDDDLEFDAVKDNLRQLVNLAMRTARPDATIDVSDNALYSIYAGLKDIVQMSKSAPVTYRVSSNQITYTFARATNVIADMGTSVVTLQQNVAAQSEFLRSEWGKAITKESGQRMIVLSLADLTKPSQENLRVLFHEVAHHIMNGEPANIRRAIHSAIDKAGKLRQSVFSKTLDSRISETGSPLSGAALTEEVLAEHLSFLGISKTEAHSAVQRIIDGVIKAISRATIALFSSLEITPPVWAAQKYAELRMQDFLDKVYAPKQDIHDLSGTVRDTAIHKAGMLRQIGGKVSPVEIDHNTGNVYTKDVVENSDQAVLFNLDNRLMWHDTVVQESQATRVSVAELYEREFGVTSSPTKASEILPNLTANEKIVQPYGVAAQALQNLSTLTDGMIVRVASTAEDFAKLETESKDSYIAGVYDPNTNEVILSPNRGGELVNPSALASTVLHEIMHGATERAMLVYSDFLTFGDMEMVMDKWNLKSKAEFNSIISAGKRLDALYQYAKSQKIWEGAHEMKNLSEFAAGVISNAALQKLLYSKPLPAKFKSPRKSIFHEVIDAILSMFKSAKKATTATLLDEYHAALEQVIIAANKIDYASANYYAEFRPSVVRTPATVGESDAMVKQDFEFELAGLNSMVDLYDNLLSSSAASKSLTLDEYLRDMLKIYSPLRARDLVLARANSRARPIRLNENLRITATRGEALRIKNEIDRQNLSKRVQQTVQSGLDDLHKHVSELEQQVPDIEAAIVKTTDEFVKFEETLRDVQTLRDRALKTLRKNLSEMERNATRMVGLMNQHDGLGGVVTELFKLKVGRDIPQNIVDLMLASLAENKDNFKFTDVLTALATAEIDVDALTPTEVVDAMRTALASNTNPAIRELFDGSPKATADLALTVYYAKTHPKDMAALLVRVSKAPRQNHILAKLREVIQGNYSAADDVVEALGDVRKGDQAVGKAKRTFQEVSRQLRQLKNSQKFVTERLEETRKAQKILFEGLRTTQANIRQQAEVFFPHNGATIIITADPKGEPTTSTLKLGKDSMAGVTTVILQNQAWLDQNENVKDQRWYQIQSQVDGLKMVASEQLERNMRTSTFTSMVESVPERLRALGNSLATQAANRLVAYKAARLSGRNLVARSHAVNEAHGNAMKATGFSKSYDGFQNVLWNPAYSFIEHLRLTDPDVVLRAEEVKRKLRNQFQRNSVAREAVSRPGAYDALWNALMLNADLSQAIAKFGQQHGVMVQDDSMKSFNYRTKKFENFTLREAMAVGPMTVQRFVKGVLLVKRQLSEIKDPTDGGSLWDKWRQGALKDPEGKPRMPSSTELAAMFDVEVQRRFVVPYIYDANTLHFNAPVLADGRTRNKANPVYVMQAYEASKGDMIKFADALFDLEYHVESHENPAADREEFRASTLNFFLGQYRLFHNITEAQETFNHRNLDVLSSAMMDSRRFENLPAEFVEYAVYDAHTTENVINSLAAHGTLGRDLGMFGTDKGQNAGILWELSMVKEDLANELRDYVNIKQKLLLTNPHSTLAELDAAVLAQVGEKKFKFYKNLTEAELELGRLDAAVQAIFFNPNGGSRSMQIASETLGAMTGLMVNSIRGAITNSAQVFEPFIYHGVGAEGRKRVATTIENYARSGLGAITQGLLNKAALVTDMDRFMHDNNIGADMGNTLTASQILADRGRNNEYAERKGLEYLRKGKALFFNLGFAANDQKERIAPKLRPQAPFSTLAVSLNWASMKDALNAYNNVLSKALKAALKDPTLLENAGFQFTQEQLGMTGPIYGDLNFADLKHELRIMGTTLELEVRDLVKQYRGGKPIGDVLLSPKLAQRIASRAEDRMSLPNDVTTAPVMFFSTPFGRFASKLLTWPVSKMGQLVGRFRGDAYGEMNKRLMYATALSMLAGVIPASILLSLFLDQFDEKVLGKKANLVGFRWDDPAQTAVALTERLARTGTFGLAGDVVNGLRGYATEGDLRGLSFDQRVVFMNSIMSVLNLANTAFRQEGTLTYHSFWRPFEQAIGLGGLLQNQQIINRMSLNITGQPVFEKEYAETARLNALNYLRAAGRVEDLNVRTGAGTRSLPNPTKPWIYEMVLSAYTGNRFDFTDAYRKAVQSAREEGKEDPEDYVKKTFASYHPLKYVFATTPSAQEYSRALATMSEKGRSDVSDALSTFNSFMSSLGIAPPILKGNEKSAAKPKAYKPVSLF